MLRKRIAFAGILTGALLSLFVIGCKDKSTDPTASELTADEDAAETVAGAMGEDNGGAMDQLADVTEIAATGGLALAPVSGGLSKSEGVATFSKSYDAATKKWTGILDREKRGLFQYSRVYRIYEWSFQKNGVGQQTYIAGTDTANTISFKILSGKAYAWTVRWEHLVDSLTTNWTITNANKDTLTINGSVYRTATDTLLTRNATRTLRNKLQLTYSNVRAPRGNRLVVSSAASGTVNGTYDATVTFLRGTSYSERTISRTIDVTFSGGTGTIRINGRPFLADLRQGILK